MASRKNIVKTDASPYDKWLKPPYENRGVERHAHEIQQMLSSSTFKPFISTFPIMHTLVFFPLPSWKQLQICLVSVRVEESLGFCSLSSPF